MCNLTEIFFLHHPFYSLNYIKILFSQTKGLSLSFSSCGAHLSDSHFLKVVIVSFLSSFYLHACLWFVLSFTISCFLSQEINHFLFNALLSHKQNASLHYFAHFPPCNLFICSCFIFWVSLIPLYLRLIIISINECLFVYISIYCSYSPFNQTFHLY